MTDLTKLPGLSAEEKKWAEMVDTVASLLTVTVATTPDEAKNYDAAIWYDDGDACALLHTNLAHNYEAADYAELFAAAPSAMRSLLETYQRSAKR